jgi:superfamily II DNA/RNA helicase
VHSTDLAGLGQKLRRKIPTTIVVGHRTGRTARAGRIRRAGMSRSRARARQSRHLLTLRRAKMSGSTTDSLADYGLVRWLTTSPQRLPRHSPRCSIR